MTKARIRTFSIKHSVPEKIAPIIAKVFAMCMLLEPIVLTAWTNCWHAVIVSAWIGVSRAPNSIPMNTPIPPPAIAFSQPLSGKSALANTCLVTSLLASYWHNPTTITLKKPRFSDYWKDLVCMWKNRSFAKNSALDEWNPGSKDRKLHVQKTCFTAPLFSQNRITLLCILDSNA